MQCSATHRANKHTSNSNLAQVVAYMAAGPQLQAGLATVDVPSTVWEGLMQGRIDGASPIVSSTWGQHQRVCAESAYEGRCSMFFLVASTPAARDRAAARIATLLSTVPPTTPASAESMRVPMISAPLLLVGL